MKRFLSKVHVFIRAKFQLGSKKFLHDPTRWGIDEEHDKSKEHNDDNDLDDQPFESRAYQVPKGLKGVHEPHEGGVRATGGFKSRGFALDLRLMKS